MTLLTTFGGVPVSTRQTWDRYKSLTTGFEVTDVQLGDIGDFRFYCDDPSALTVYITKAPVCKLILTPTVQFTSTNIAWDISGSHSPSSTLLEFNIEWGGTTDIGNLTNRSWTSDPQTGNVQYTATGIYTVTAWVKQIASPTTSAKVKVTVNIVEFVALQRAYIGTTDTGLFIDTPGGSPTAANGGLTGNHVNFRAVRMHPTTRVLPVAQHHLWATTQDGVAYTTDGVASNWNLITEATLGTPVNDAADDPAPTASAPDNIDIAFDPQDPSTIVVLRTTATRSWAYISTDYGVTWSNYQVSVA